MDPRVVFFLGLVTGVILMWIFRCKAKSTTSNYTPESFDGKSLKDATDSYKAQLQQISTELQAELVQAKGAKKSKTELIAITDKYNDYTCQLTKAYSAATINASAS